jgi:hypothetical protein
MAIEELMDAIGFDEEDLDANSHGYMSKRQRIMLRRKSHVLNIFISELKDIIRFSVAPLALLPFTWLILIKFLTVPGYNLATLYLDIPPFLAEVVLAALIIYWPVAMFTLMKIPFSRRRFNSDLLKGDVAQINGHVHLDHEETEEPRRFRLKRTVAEHNKLAINGLNFRPSGKVWSAFSNNRYHNYQIYYAPNTQIILSAEFIDTY